MKPRNLEKIKLFLGRTLPAPIFRIVLFFRILYKNIRMPEQKKSFGKLHPEKTFYVIRLYPPATGWLANYNYILGYIKYAQERDLIPVVDMEHYSTLYTEQEAVNGTKNVWEYFFKQPSPYTLEEVYKSKNVILSNGSLPLCNMSMQPDVLQWQRKMSLLVPFNITICKHIEEVKAKLLPIGKRILGVPIRGSDLSQRVIGHNIPASKEELLPLIEKKIKQLKIDYVYLVSEEAKTINYFKDKLKNVIYSDIPRIKETQEKNNSESVLLSMTSVAGKFSGLLNYQTDIYILSKCTALIGSLSNGLYTAIIWSQGQLEDIEIIDKGKYK